jgi:hypothetical protein
LCFLLTFSLSRVLFSCILPWMYSCYIHSSSPFIFV